jgi:hypothetical protein
MIAIILILLLFGAAFIVTLPLLMLRASKVSRPCPKCTMPISKKASKCPHCTADVQ